MAQHEAHRLGVGLGDGGREPRSALATLLTDLVLELASGAAATLNCLVENGQQESSHLPLDPFDPLDALGCSPLTWSPASPSSRMLPAPPMAPT